MRIVAPLDLQSSAMGCSFAFSLAGSDELSKPK
jgi:hypothetical protein